MRTQSRTKVHVVDLSARILAAMCALNINGMANMMLDKGNMVSILMLVTSLILIIKRGNAARSRPLVLLISAIASYLFLATAFYDPLMSVDEPMKFYRAYGSAILIIWGIAAYTASIRKTSLCQGWLSFLRNLFLVSAGSIWISPVLYEYYVNTPNSFELRMGGFFGNPNEAAIASLFAVALLFAVPFRRRVLQLSLLTMAAGAVVMTFSKTGISALVVLLAWHAFLKLKGLFVVLIPVVAVLAIITLQNINYVLEVVVENPYFELELSQQHRILAVGKILTGTFSAETTTNRVYVWGLALDDIWENFPLASGLGSAHSIIGGFWANDHWVGVHNSFLMLLYEAGFIPLGLLIASLIMLASAAFRSGARLIHYSLFILVADMLASHGVLAVRFENLMLAVIMGMVASRASSTTMSPHPTSQKYS